MATPRDLLVPWLDLSDAGSDTTPPAEDDQFLGDPAELRRHYAIEEAEEIGLWCFVTRQDDRAWHRLTRLERNAMADAIHRAHRRR
ncbi:hypothetical protein [Nocardioides sp. 503]|uniref:hypothetical protein n=1 Tax=Nocardioides sp. 503 TaxID=2508326 RepID=UPI00106FB02E|nr:hypothetical protein [Nocardioides sp. 503]